MKPLGVKLKNPNKSYSQKLITLLEEQQSIDKNDLQLVAKLQQQSRGKSLSSILIDVGIDEELVQQAVADVNGLRFTKITFDCVDLELVSKFGLNWCKSHNVLPVRLDEGVFIASATTEELFLTEDICSNIAEPIGQLLTTHKIVQEILERLEQLDSESHSLEDILYEKEGAEPVDLQEEANFAESSPVVKFVGDMIAAAVREDASDIHFEAGDDCSTARYRIDGVLHNLMQCTSDLHNAIVSRLKILSNLDISERRIPQDGRIRANVLGRQIDLRMSTVPTPKGEKVVLRILDDRNIRIGLDQLGFRKDALDAWKHEIESPHGIILVTGPTGCGKTTTLYSSLQEMDRKRLNISTVEDPVEYELSGITQIQVHDKIDMTFSRALRALLRQDPDVVLLGEIRDMETASVAIQAAMTGHLVLSTLHTNDAPSSLTRLINIGVEPFLVASAVNGVLAQRLARRVCLKCVQMKTPNEKEAKFLDGFGCEEIPHAVGCSTCRGSGYSGRLGIYELLIMDDELRDAIASNPTITSFRNLSIERGMLNLRHDGFAKVADGLTTVDEILRLTQ